MGGEAPEGEVSQTVDIPQPDTEEPRETEVGEGGGKGLHNRTTLYRNLWPHSTLRTHNRL